MKATTENWKIIIEHKKLVEELYDTDREAVDFLEGAITLSEYAETKARRQEIRRRIKELEEQLGV